jgi:hypothetical protein
MMILPDTLSRAYPPTNTEGTLFDEELASLASVDTEQMAELKMVASRKRSVALHRQRKTMNTSPLMKQIATVGLHHRRTWRQIYDRTTHSLMS